MKNALLVVVALVILGILIFKMLPTTSAPVQTTDLNAELEKTVDDGGKADFDSLDKDASGL